MRWSLGSTAAGLWLRKNYSGERGSDVAGKERVHRRVSQAADSKAKLTVALDGARAQRRPRNRQWSSAGSGGAPWLWGERERVWQTVQMSGEGGAVWWTVTGLHTEARARSSTDDVVVTRVESYTSRANVE